MSKTSIILNGENTNEVKEYISDGNINMGSATNDNSCSIHLDTFNSKDNKAGIPYPCDFDHLYATGMSENESSTDKNTEIIQLKELLLLHLDLIQQQSEQLVTKDKQISALKQENETLKQRLERMDRRVTLHKQRELSDVLTSTNTSATATVPDVELLPEPIATSSDVNINQESDILSSVTNNEDKSQVSRRRKEDKLSGSGSVLCASGPKRRNRSLSWTSSVTSADVTPSTKVNGGKLIKRERLARREKRRKKRCKKTDSIDEQKDDNILTTESPYYTPVGDANNIWNTDEAPISGCVLEVPSWRVKVFTSCYTMEGTENLSDDVFDRRHSRLEIDERRRKRWDVQRIREQRQLEKLRQRGIKRSGGSSDGEEVVSLWPSPDEAQLLQVQDSLPVAAFGCPISNLNPVDSEFTLPWVNGREFGRSRTSFASRKKR